MSAGQAGRRHGHRDPHGYYAPSGTNPNLSNSMCSTQAPNVDIAYSSYTATPTSVTFYSTQFVFSVTYTKS